MSAQQPTESARGRILVVDDHEEWRSLLETILSVEGHEVVLTDSGTEALSIASSMRPDIILLGLSRWRVNGTRTAERLRGLEGLENAPIILITSAEERGNCYESPAPHMNGYINRRDVLKELADCVRYWLKSSSNI